MANVFDFLNSINKKTYLTDLSGYSQFMINRLLSSDQQYVPIISEVNSTYKLTDKMHYDLMYYAFPKSSKFFKYNMKKEAQEKNLQYVMDWFKVDSQIAKSYIQLMDEKELDQIISYFEDRGSKGTKATKKKGKK